MREKKKKFREKHEIYVKKHKILQKELTNFASFSLNLFSRKNEKFHEKFAKCKRKFSHFFRERVSFAGNPRCFAFFFCKKVLLSEMLRLLKISLFNSPETQ